MKACTAPVLLLATSLGLGLAACGDKQAPAPAPVAAPAPAPAPVTAAPAPAAAKPAAAPAPVASTDPDAPTPLPAKELKGVGIKQKLSYYYAFNAGAGPIKIVATAKNAPSGATQALMFGLYDARANRLCYDSHGNTNSDKTITLTCNVDKAQPLVLRLDLGEETIDYAVSLEGAVELPPPAAAGAAKAIAGPGSTDIDEPTRLSTNRIKGEGTKQQVSYYYTFNAGPGELIVTGDGKNVSAGTANALGVTLYTLRSEKICNLSLGNTTIDKRETMACKLDKRQPVILRLDLAPETIDFRAKFEGPYDFEPFEAPKAITIALDSAVLFDTGKAVLKPEARDTLHEAAVRVRKFADASVLVSGHTDNVGNAASNQKLSDERAAAVKAYFVNEEKLAAGSMTVKGFGKSQPVADNGSEAGRARNRRVDVVITPKS
jgi:outer membrane protein OmpA-like peptidoglycan-associated protein